MKKRLALRLAVLASAATVFIATAIARLTADLPASTPTSER